MSVAFATVVYGYAYRYMFEMALLSFVEHHNTRHPWYVYTKIDGTDLGVTEDDIKRWKKIYKNLHIVEVDDSHYPLEKHSPKFWIFEAYKLGHDIVVCFDADLIFMGNCCGLWRIQHPGISAKPETKRYLYNSGVVVLGKDVRGIEIYSTLLNKPLADCKDYYGNDQRVINAVFEWQIKPIPVKYNVFVDEITDIGGMENARILHYWIKPRAEGSRERIPVDCYRLWQRYWKRVEPYYV